MPDGRSVRLVGQKGSVRTRPAPSGDSHSWLFVLQPPRQHCTCSVELASYGAIAYAEQSTCFFRSEAQQVHQDNHLALAKTEALHGCEHRQAGIRRPALIVGEVLERDQIPMPRKSALMPPKHIGCRDESVSSR